MASYKYDVCMLLQHSFRNDSRVLREARSLANHGFDVLLIALKDPDEEAVENVSGFTIQRIPLWSRRIQGPWALGFKLVEFLVRFGLSAINSRARVYHAHHPISLFPGALAATIRRSKLVYDCHELAIAIPGDGPLKRRFVRLYERAFLRFVDRVIMSDGASRADAFRKAHRYHRPIEYIYNCPVEVDVSRDIKDIRTALKIGTPDRLVVYTGDVGPFRGLNVAITSMAYWPKNAHFVMVGTSSEDFQNQLMQLAAAQQVRHRVHFWGPVPPDDLALWVADADVALVLIQNVGLSYYYSTPTKMFEAIMARVPQVSSDFPEIRRVILGNDIGPVGRLVDPSDHEEIGQTVRELLTDETLRNSYAKNADALARTICNWESQERVLISLYNRMLGVSCPSAFPDN